MTNKKYLNRWNSALQGNYGSPSITLVKGKGILVTDADGKIYMDFLGGIATNIFNVDLVQRRMIATVVHAGLQM
jgi:acetylornithine aminotransferase